MRTLAVVVVCGGLLLCTPRICRADVWDMAVTNDDLASTTRNELTHGSDQMHDLGARYSDVAPCTYVVPTPCPDADWYRISAGAYSSWEVMVEGTTGDVGSTFTFSRYDSAGTTALQQRVSVSPGLDYAKFLAWQNTSSSDVISTLLVRNAACGISCGTTDQYRIRAFETTIAVPRFNNSNGQVTVLMCQNTGSRATISGTAYLWNESDSATPVTTLPISLDPRDVDTYNLASVNGGAANNTRGAITVTHDGLYGEVVCKAVALEPATGFSFDSPGVTRPK